MLLVTGAGGFLGSAVVAQAVAAGRAVRAAVRDVGRAATRLPDGVEIVAADLADPAALTAAARGCSGVLHLAGAVGGGAAEIRAVNVEGTRNVLAAARAAGAGRVVLTSSSAAVFDATGLVAEHPMAPPALTDPYSVSKAEAEALALAEGAVVANPVSIYGPSPAGPLSYNGLLLAAARGEIDEVVDATIGWVLAADAAVGHLLALDRGEPGHRYVLCGEVAPFGRVLHAFADATGGRRVRALPPGSDLGPAAGTFARRSEVYGKFPPVRIDDSGARALGFTAAGVADGLARTVAWLTQQCR